MMYRFDMEMKFFLRYNQFLTKFQNCMIPHLGGAESAPWSIASRPYRISHMLKCHMIMLIIRHKVTKNPRHNFYDKKPILDFQRGEQIFLPHVK